MDYTQVTKSIELFPKQVKTAFSEASEINIEAIKNNNNINNIIICGMGGSALGARILDSYTSKINISVINNYKIPDFADKNSLIIISSYSGNTEEIVSCFEDALSKDLNIFAIATDGKIAEIAKQNNTTSYIFDPTHNPSKQPRLASGYSIGAMLAIFNNLNILDISKSDLDEALSLNIDEIKNKAKSLAIGLEKFGVILVASDHLVGAAHAVKNMLNESAKAFSALFEIPELNHHLMEGLSRPEDLENSTKFLFINSDIYHKRIIKRYEITKDVLTQNNFKYLEYKMSGETKLKQIFEVLAFGGYLQIYLGQIYDVDPVAIPWVDYFKSKMSS